MSSIYRDDKTISMQPNKKRKTTSPQETVTPSSSLRFAVTPVVADFVRRFGCQIDHEITEANVSPRRALPSSPRAFDRISPAAPTPLEFKEGDLVQYLDDCETLCAGVVKKVVQQGARARLEGRTIFSARDTLGPHAIHQYFQTSESSHCLIVSHKHLWLKEQCRSWLLTAQRFRTESSKVTGRVEAASATVAYEHDPEKLCWESCRTARKAGHDDMTFVAATSSHSAAILYKGQTIHEYDFVYLLPRRPSVFEIAQIQELRQTKKDGGVYMQLRPTRRDATDIRLLHLEPITSCFTFIGPQSKLFGKCHVYACSRRRPPRLIDDFWTKDEVRTCAICATPNVESSSDSTPPRSHSPLRVLDVFAGAGGLSLGLESCVQQHSLDAAFEVTWAIENDHAAAQTFRRAFPTACVLEEDASKVLREVLFDHSERSSSKRLVPRLGEIEVIVSGPPCQGFTGMNRYTGQDDESNFQILVALSYVEAFRPKYVVLENVPTMAEASIGKEGPGSWRQIVVLILLALGYSVRLVELQADEYGCPQSRRRLFVIACQSHLPLPRIPPTVTMTLTTTASSSHHAHGPAPAPFPAISSSESICDLPSWDWKDPHHVYGNRMTSHDDELSQRQRRHGIPTFTPSITSDVVGHFWQRYATQPQNWFQRAMRSSGEDAVSQHQTVRLCPLDIERVVSVPLRPRANHLDWSSPRVDREQLALASQDTHRRVASFEDRVKSLPTEAYAFRRLDGAESFPTICGGTLPATKSGTRLHPTCARVLTIRELARAQGFPDEMQFEGTAQEVHSQIGNAVPPPLARALGKVILESWSRAEKQASESNAGSGQ